MDNFKSSDVTTMMAQLKLANSKVVELSTALAPWKLYVASSVAPAGEGRFELHISFAKGNNNGFVKVISADELDYYAADPESLILMLTNEILEKLYKDQVRSEITESVVKGLRNSQAMQKKV